MPRKAMIMTSGLTRGSVPAIIPPWPTQALGLWTNAYRYVALVLAVARERRELAALDDRMLKDIGMSRSLVEREVVRRVLDVPEHRLGGF
jgi:uncharacterized protein YjiS (DUF1127 family)